MMVLINHDDLIDHDDHGDLINHDDDDDLPVKEM